jgi:hypothetical protein
VIQTYAKNKKGGEQQHKLKESRSLLREAIEIMFRPILIFGLICPSLDEHVAD